MFNLYWAILFAGQVAFIPVEESPVFEDLASCKAYHNTWRLRPETEAVGRMFASLGPDAVYTLCIDETKWDEVEEGLEE